MAWTADDIGNQQDRVFLVTGANTGLGFQTSLELAKQGAHVVLAGRDPDRIANAIVEIEAVVPWADVEPGIVDLGSLESVREFAQGFLSTHDRLDVLINNAGVMFPPAGTTVDGFETQFGINYLGHFALTAHLFRLLAGTENSRVVTLSSILHRGGKIDFDNLKLEKPFDKRREYSQSKAADLIFVLELQRKIIAAELNVLSVGAHPGISKTELLRYDDPNMIEGMDYMSASQGALSTLYAATANVEGGGYYGPDGKGEVNGYPAPAAIASYAKAPTIGAELWDYSEHQTGLEFL
jgi:NAD(P)-dependent dehydrogenase (short-subunit alcohol dehydrogenase family)